MADTPARSTRSRSKKLAPTALPAVPARQSFAYGAQGKAVLRTQVAPEGNDFATIMGPLTRAGLRSGSQQSSLPGEDDEETTNGHVAAPKTPRRRRTALPALAVLVEDDSDDNSNDVSGNHGNGKNTAKSLSQPHNAKATNSSPCGELEAAAMDRNITNLDGNIGYLQGAPAILQQSQAVPMPAVAAARGDDGYVPNRAMVFLRTLWLYVRQYCPRAIWLFCEFFGWLMLLAVMCLTGGGLIYSLVSLAPLPASADTWRSDFIQKVRIVAGVTPYDVPPTVLQERWNRFQHEGIWARELPDYNVPEMQWAININLKGRIERIEENIGQLNQKMKLHDNTMTMLEQILPDLVVVSTADNRWELSEPFWRALLERVTTDESIRSPLWDSFLEENDRQIEQVNSDFLDGKHLISRNMMRDAIQESYIALKETVDEKIQTAGRVLLAEAKRAAESTSTDLIEKSPANRLAKIEVGAVAYSNLLANTRTAMREVNFFAPGLGAHINPHYTSPTALGPKSKQHWFSVSNAHPPIAALQRWEEATDCWCAAPSTQLGKAQLSIIMGSKIFPERLVVEHIPALGTNNIAAAPRTLEVWAEVDPLPEAMRVNDLVAKRFNPACGDAPSNLHVCLGKVQYDIHADNWVQSAELTVHAQEIGLAVDKIIIRATSNWGSDWTCFYRLRMTGTSVVEAAHGHGAWRP